MFARVGLVGGVLGWIVHGDSAANVDLAGLAGVLWQWQRAESERRRQQLYAYTSDMTAAQAALRRDLTPGGAVALLVFFAFAMQCMSTIAVVRRETGSWKWPLVQFAYMTALAWGGAFVANRIVSALL